MTLTTHNLHNSHVVIWCTHYTYSNSTPNTYKFTNLHSKEIKFETYHTIKTVKKKISYLNEKLNSIFTRQRY